MASSANASKTLVISYEKKCAELESALSSKCSELELSETKLKSAEENLAAVIEQKEKQSDQLIVCTRSNEDLKSQLSEQGKSLKEIEAKCRDQAERIKFLESAEFTAGVIQTFRDSEEYGDEVFKKSNTFFERGCAHAFRNFHQLIPDKQKMVEVYLGIAVDPQFRNGSDFVPFTEEEMQEIKEMDQNEGRVWNPPALTSPNFNDLVREKTEASTSECPAIREVHLTEENQPTEVGQTSVVEPSEGV